jgi:hypothetical protein
MYQARAIDLMAFHGDCHSQTMIASKDEESNKEAEEFEDWIDNLYSFVHMINNPICAPKSEGLVHILSCLRTDT